MLANSRTCSREAVRAVSRRIPSDDFMLTSPRCVQSRLNGRIVLRNGVERPVEDGAAPSERNVGSRSWLPPFVGRGIERLIQRREPPVALFISDRGHNQQVA